MARIQWFVYIATALTAGAWAQNERFSKYKSVEVYEARPGILMMPRYAQDGQVCEIGFEKRHYSPEVVSTISAFSDQEIDELVDEFAPEGERGSRPSGFLGRDAILGVGHILSHIRNYENVVVETYAPECRGRGRSTCTEGDIVLTIQWRNRKCK